jgi:hypothetical protein
MATTPEDPAPAPGLCRTQLSPPHYHPGALLVPVKTPHAKKNMPAAFAIANAANAGVFAAGLRHKQTGGQAFSERWL